MFRSVAGRWGGARDLRREKRRHGRGEGGAPRARPSCAGPGGRRTPYARWRRAYTAPRAVCTSTGTRAGSWTCRSCRVSIKSQPPCLSWYDVEKIQLVCLVGCRGHTKRHCTPATESRRIHSPDHLVCETSLACCPRALCLIPTAPEQQQPQPGPGASVREHALLHLGRQHVHRRRRHAMLCSFPSVHWVRRVCVVSGSARNPTSAWERTGSTPARGGLQHIMDVVSRLPHLLSARVRQPVAKVVSASNPTERLALCSSAEREAIVVLRTWQLMAAAWDGR
jgi:hypothetical protein